MPTPTFLQALNSRADLRPFGKNAFLLFALELHFGVEDSATTAANSITDGPDDKKADLVYIDEDRETVVIAQGYVAEKNKSEAPANKAADLNTSMTWLISADLNSFPENLRAHAVDLRKVLEGGKVQQVLIWYVHNCPESTNVQKELDVVRETARASLLSAYPQRTFDIQASEVGIGTLDRWYTEMLAPILVSDRFEIPLESPGYEITSADWKAYVTSVPGAWLHEQFKRYKTRIFSANVRDYLGSRNSDANINNGIKTTASVDPAHFWVFNNGITALVNSFTESKGVLTINGISIVNGAQTTGAIGSLGASPSRSLRVAIRFVECRNQQTVQNIVRFNNSQNKISAPDFRSNDTIQTRLEREIESCSDLQYGSRRGGHEDVIRRPANYLPSITAGQAIAAFQEHPEIAYHQKTEIWESDHLYSRYFNDHTKGPHVFLVYSLQRSVETKKLELNASASRGPVSQIDKEKLEFFRHRGSIFLFVAAIGASIEVVIGKPYPSKFDVKFRNRMTLDVAISLWKPIVNVTSSFVSQLNSGVADLRNRAELEACLQKFRGMVAATEPSNIPAYATLRAEIT